MLISFQIFYRICGVSCYVIIRNNLENTLERDKFLSAAEAVAFGIADHVATKRTVPASTAASI